MLLTVDDKTNVCKLGLTQWSLNSFELFFCCVLMLLCLCPIEIRQSTIYYAGLLGRWDKWIVDQASDVPSIIFLRLFIDLGHSKLFTFIFVFLEKNKQIDWKYFCKEFCKKSFKKIMLGTSDAWSTIHLSHRPSNRAWIYLRLTNFRCSK